TFSCPVGITRYSPGKRSERARRLAWKYCAPRIGVILPFLFAFQFWSLNSRKASGGAVSWLSRAGALVFCCSMCFTVLLPSAARKRRQVSPQGLRLSQAPVQAVGTRAHDRQRDQGDAHLDGMAGAKQRLALRQILRGGNHHHEGHARAGEASEEAEDEEDASAEFRHGRSESPGRGREMDSEIRHGRTDRLPALGAA